MSFRRWLPSAHTGPCWALVTIAALPPAAAVAEVEQSVVFTSGEDGYHTYRIPAIVRAADGDLLAFAEGRKNGGGDAGDIDIVVKRSSDGGATWGEMRLVQDEWDAPAASVTIGNPAPVVDSLDPQHPDRVWLAFCRNNDRVFVTHSDDHGLTWSDRREITSSAKRSSWGWYATGPVHGIQLERGEHAGRLIIPSDHRIANTSAWGAHVLYSDDHGQTWKIGAEDTHSSPSDLRPNENVAVELVDGRVYINARNQDGGGGVTRAIAYSSDGGLSYDDRFAPEPNITTPVVQNSALRFAATDQGDDRNILVYSAPGQPNSRRDLTIQVSFDEGRTWVMDTLLDPGPTAYSDLVKLSNERIGVLYEGGETTYANIFFASFGLDDLAAEPWNGVPGDIDQNGVLNRADLDAFVRAWSPGRVTYYGGKDSYTHGDLDFNGVTDLADAGLLRRAFRDRGLSVKALDRLDAAPEPASLWLAAGAWAAHASRSAR